VQITANFWIDTNDSKPLAVFDRAAVSVMRSLLHAGIELFPPGSMIVQQPKDTPPPPDEEAPKKDIFD
jgi:hypothetical protein